MGDEVDSLENSVSSAWNSISSTGAPAVIAGVENYASQQLAQQATANQAQAQAAVQTAIKNGQPATGVMASIEGMFTNIAQGAVFKQYGLYIVGGAILAVLLIRRI